MYHYRNKKSGTVIKTACKVSGKNWELIEDTQQPPVDDTPEEETGMEDIPEVPAGKPETSRRGKK